MALMDESALENVSLLVGRVEGRDIQNPRVEHIAPSPEQLQMRSHPSVLLVRDAIQDASAINTAGVASLAKDNVESALASFRGALEVVHGTGVHLQELDDFLDGEHQPISNWTPVCESVAVPDFEDDYIYLCNHALAFKPDISSPSLLEEVANLNGQASFYGAAIMFNIALCIHKMANSKPPGALKRRALMLYDMCIQALETFPLSADTEKVSLLYCAAWNNKAQIFYQLGDFERTATLLQDVMFVCSALLPIANSGRLSVEDQTVIHELLLTASVFKEPTTAAKA